MKTRMIALAICTISAAALPAAAQQAPGAGGGAPPPAVIPQTPAGDAARALVEAVNAPDEEALRGWTERYLAEDLFLGWTPERVRAMLGRVRQQSGGVEVLRVMDSGDPHHVGLVLGARSGAGRTGLELIGDPRTGRIRFVEGHVMQAPPPPAGWPRERVSVDDAAAAVEARVARMAEADRFSGVVLLAHGDRVMFHRAFGMADRDAGRANTLDTRFGVGSLPKMMTAVAIAQLVEQGRLRFTDTLGAFLPGYPNAQARRTVTVHHLLTHTAGIVDVFASPRRDPRARYSTPSEWVALVADLPLEFAPGERHAYSNGGYAVLGRIVEVVSGQPLDAYLREHVLRPAGAAAGDAEAHGRLPRARGYSRVPEWDPFGVEPRRSNEWMVGDGPQTTFNGFGGAAMTADDVFRFLLALRGGRLVSPQMARTVMEGKVPLGPEMPVQYAYGFYDDRGRGAPIVGHSGGGASSGIGAQAEMVGAWTLVVMGNYDLEQDVRPLAGGIAAFLARQEAAEGR